MAETPTAFDLERHWRAMLDSVALINELSLASDPDDLFRIEQNVMHLEAMLKNDWWAGYDLAPINAAIITGKQ